MKSKQNKIIKQKYIHKKTKQNHKTKIHTQQILFFLLNEFCFWWKQGKRECVTHSRKTRMCHTFSRHLSVPGCRRSNAHTFSFPLLSIHYHCVRMKTRETRMCVRLIGDNAELSVKVALFLKKITKQINFFKKKTWKRTSRYVRSLSPHPPIPPGMGGMCVCAHFFQNQQILLLHARAI